MRVLSVIDIVFYRALLAKIFCTAGVEYDFVTPEEADPSCWLSGPVPDAVLIQDSYMTPILVESTLSRGLSPLPYLLGLALAANIGSAATLIGNPQNMHSPKYVPFLRMISSTLAAEPKPGP